MSPLLVLLTGIGYLHHFGIKISKIEGDTANKNMDMNEIFLNSPNVDWHCCLAGSSKTAPRILIFSIVIGADYSYEVKNSEIWVPAIFKHNNSFKLLC